MATMTMTRDEVIAVLLKNGAKLDRATIYADCFLEYRRASDNIEEFGLLVKDPRTGRVMENPYLGIRAAAEKKLSRMQNIKSDGLW